MAKKLAELDPIENAEKEYFGSRDDKAEDRTVSSRAMVREALSSQIEEFLSKGGQISEIAPNVVADPPKKPTSNYGSRPI